MLTGVAVIEFFFIFYLKSRSTVRIKYDEGCINVHLKVSSLNLVTWAYIHVCAKYKHIHEQYR